MHCLRKKISALLLLALAAAPLVVSICHLVQQQHLRHRMKERLEAAALQTITIPEAALQWVKKDKEILVNGRLFDVKSIRISGSQYIVTGLFDDAETKIVKKLADEAGNSQNMAFSKSINQLLFAVYNTTHTNFVISPAIDEPENTHIHYNSRLCTCCIAVSTPPPDRA